MKKRILFVIPDYNKTSLRLVQPFLNKGFTVDLAVPFRFHWYIRLFIFLFPGSSFIKKLKRRLDDYIKYVDPRCDLITVSFFRLLRIIVRDKLNKRFFLSNSFKTLIEGQVIKKVKFKEYDLIFTFDTCALIYLYAARKAGVRTIMELRGNLIDHSLSVNSRLNEDFGLKLDTPGSYSTDPDKVQWYGKLRDELSYTDNVLIYSNYQERQLQNINFSKENIYKIPISSPFSSKVRIKKTSGAVNFIYVGNLSYAKGSGYLLRAWESIARSGKLNGTLTLVGKPFPEFMHELNRLPENVHYKGFLFHQQLVNELEAAHVFIMPSCNDSYGVVVAEALAYNMPVICSPNVGASDLIKIRETGLIYKDAFSTEDLREAILYFMENTSDVERISTNISKMELDISRAAEIQAAEKEISRLIT